MDGKAPGDGENENGLNGRPRRERKVPQKLQVYATGNNYPATTESEDDDDGDRRQLKGSMTDGLAKLSALVKLSSRVGDHPENDGTANMTGEKNLLQDFHFDEEHSFPMGPTMDAVLTHPINSMACEYDAPEDNRELLLLSEDKEDGQQHANRDVIKKAALRTAGEQNILEKSTPVTSPTGHNNECGYQDRQASNLGVTMPKRRKIDVPYVPESFVVPPPPQYVSVVQFAKNADQNILKMIWTAINDTRQFLTLKIDQLETKITSRLDAADEHIASMERKLSRHLASEFPLKPSCLPLKTREDFTAFEKIPNEEYEQAVLYLGKLTRGTIRDRANLVIKFSIDDSLSPQITMQGGEKGTLSVEGTRFGRCVYAAVASGLPLDDQPDRKTYIDAVTAALKAAKQRYIRNRTKA